MGLRVGGPDLNRPAKRLRRRAGRGDGRHAQSETGQEDAETPHPGPHLGEFRPPAHPHLSDGRQHIRGVGDEVPEALQALSGALQARNVVNRAISGNGTITATGGLLIGELQSLTTLAFPPAANVSAGSAATG